jgi:hypothetical protein
MEWLRSGKGNGQLVPTQGGNSELEKFKSCLGLTKVFKLKHAPQAAMAYFQALMQMAIVML